MNMQPLLSYNNSLRIIVQARLNVLKSSCGQYWHSIGMYEAKGVMFKTYLYVPEKHPQTNNTSYEWEDEAHLIKVVLDF